MNASGIATPTLWLLVQYSSLDDAELVHRVLSDFEVVRQEKNIVMTKHGPEVVQAYVCFETSDRLEALGQLFALRDHFAPADKSPGPGEAHPGVLAENGFATLHYAVIDGDNSGYNSSSSGYSLILTLTQTLYAEGFKYPAALFKSIVKSSDSRDELITDLKSRKCNVSTLKFPLPCKQSAIKYEKEPSTDAPMMPRRKKTLNQRIARMKRMLGNTINPDLRSAHMRLYEEHFNGIP